MYSVPAGPEIFEKARGWCVEEFGDTPLPLVFPRWYGLANSNEIGGYFYFKYSEDAVAFKLRW